jgi:hypothetical protein
MIEESNLRKFQAATIIAKTVKYVPEENESPEEIIKHSLESADNIQLTKEQKETLSNMVKLSESFDEEDDITDEELESMADEFKDFKDIASAYDKDELGLIDSETGEEVNEELINEVLSRQERIRAKVRFMRTQTRRERKLQMALKRKSSNQTLMKRARRLAVASMKKKLAKKDLAKMSVNDKERVERIIQRRRKLIDRLSVKLMPRVRKIEQERLTHRLYTK